MTAAIVLAAGESRRMGRQKLLLPFGESTVIGHIVDQVLASRVDRVVVVTGHDRAGVEQALRGQSIVLVHNSRYAAGMLTSIRRGLDAVPPEAEAFLVCLGDQPSITPALINSMLDAYRESAARGRFVNGHGIVVPSYNDDTGHPIVISTRFRDRILREFDDTGLRGLIYSHPEHVYRCPVDSGAVLRDMDTLEDYESERRRFGLNLPD